MKKIKKAPLRYRGYYFDIETEFYYLQSRYYNPVWGRLLNADGIAYLGAYGALIGYTSILQRIWYHISCGEME